MLEQKLKDAQDIVVLLDLVTMLCGQSKPCFRGEGIMPTKSPGQGCVSPVSKSVGEHSAEEPHSPQQVRIAMPLRMHKAVITPF